MYKKSTHIEFESNANWFIRIYGGMRIMNDRHE